MHLYDFLLGNSNINNTTCSFFPMDTEELFNSSCYTQPENWIYHSKHITYTFNEYGHRCNSPNIVTQSNYILFSGCSHTMGVGLALEDTYPYLLSQKLNLPYYNLAVGGSGRDVLSYNLNSFLSKFSPPVLMVVQLPEVGRFTIKYNPVGDATGFCMFGPWMMNPDYKIDISSDCINLYKAIVSLKTIDFFETNCFMFDMQLQCLSKLLAATTKTLTFTEDDLFLFTKQELDTHNNTADKARDNQHYGIVSNSRAANTILAKYSNQ